MDGICRIELGGMDDMMVQCRIKQEWDGMDIIRRIEWDGLDGICRIKQDGIYLVITNTHVRSLIDLYQNHCIYSEECIQQGAET